MAGKFTAFLAEFDDRHLILVTALFAIGFLNLPFDRQTMAIPAGNVIRILAETRLETVDDILQNLVQRMADMQVAIGVGRAIMENEFLRPLAMLAELTKKVHFHPACQNLWLFLGQPGPHRKIGLWQENGGFKIACHGGFSPVVSGRWF